MKCQHMSAYVMPFHVMTCHNMSCPFMPCFVMLCRFIHQKAAEKQSSSQYLPSSTSDQFN